MADTTAEIDTSRLLRQYNIFFDLNKRQAEGHEALFRDISTLGSYDLDKYRPDITVESTQKPWRLKTVERAKAISAKALRCLEQDKNESSWRLSIESEILARFSIEVACQREHGRSGDKTEKSKNMPVPVAQAFDEGLNPLFDDRADEEIQYENEIRAKVTKGKKPDRIVGIRLTKRLDRILHETEGPDGNLIVDSIRTSPFKPFIKPLLFPFLLIEAKSEKSPDAFSKIDAQSGFALRNLLQLQRNLVHATAENRHSSVKPLVWYLAYRGEQWRLSGAYVEETKHESRPNYRILQLWRGDITEENEALRLLLILDYVFDWARDIYRRDIISGLLSLAPNASESLIADTDVGSTYDRFDHFRDVDYDEPAIGNDVGQTEPFGVPHLLKFFDDERLAIRDARYMAHKVWALYVTLENLDEFLSKMDSTAKAIQLARQLWRCICGSGTWSVTADCLNAVEKLWTGQDRESHTFQNPEQRFLASFAVDSYLTSGDHRRMIRLDLWDQVHALTYVAIAHDAVEALRKRTEYKDHTMRMNFDTSDVEATDSVLDLFRSVRFASVRQCFAAAVARSRLSSHLGSRTETITVPGFPKGLRWTSYPALIPVTFESSSIVSPAGPTAEMYKLLKIGRTEPSESFFRVSQQFSKHDIEATCPTPMTWAQSTLKLLPKTDALLVKGLDSEKVDGERRPRTWYCLFVFDTPPTNDHEETNPSETARVFRGTLQTFFDVRLRRYNFKDTKCEGAQKLEKALKILEHVAMQYSLIQSMDADNGAETGPEWIREKCKVLAYPSVKWPYSFSETINGIKQVSKDYRFSQTIHDLSVAFQTMISPQNSYLGPKDNLRMDWTPSHERKDKAKRRRVHYTPDSDHSRAEYSADIRGAITVDDTSDETESSIGSWSEDSIGGPSNGKRRRLE
ncbi:hypothetical protein FOPE_10126 [Fonsecaea pedrosoi]|nr:hypothetical protein FOPE_10126 [Fonsecaea pedrosoi]